MINIYVLDLLGTFAFAVYGAHIGLHRKLNMLGISVSAFLTALGGGTVRCLLTHTTPSYFLDHDYTIAVVFAIVFALLTDRFFQYIHFPMLLIDAVGLVTFAYIGAYKAEDAHLGLFGIMFFAGLTAAGGGVLRDAFIRKMPEVFLDSSYVIPALLLGVVYWLLLPFMAQTVSVYGLLLVCFFVRTIMIKWTMTRWIPLVKRRSLHKVEGGYIFVYRLLLGCFASVKRVLVPQSEQVQVRQEAICACGYQEKRPGTRFCPNCGKSKQAIPHEMRNEMRVDTQKETRVSLKGRNNK